MLPRCAATFATNTQCVWYTCMYTVQYNLCLPCVLYFGYTEMCPIFLIRWVGYDPEEHERVLEEYSKMETVGDLMRFI